MKKEIYQAAATGNVEFLKEAKAKDVEAAAAIYSDDDLLGLTSQGNNIIHVAALFGHLEFIKAALECFELADQRELICKTNSDGDTPLHFAAKQRTQALAELLITSYHRLFTSEDKEGENQMMAAASPWRVQNVEGNTPLHVALMNGGKSIQVAAYLTEVGPEVAAYTNNLKQTPLHLAVMYDAKGTEMSAIHMINSLNNQGAALSTKSFSFVQEKEDISLSLVRSLLQTNSEVCCLCDADGMTPLLKAAVRSNLLVVNAIIN
ncbi:protein ACCELERATED CELL DEATH 6-like [Chenopodium quinoa]|uniref:protein ACCELERATED CELL DEATH 6-like n=1 Tax=Chenopodium quinoa TaxID=63459 RepID=UPI000B7708A1|nr:protein ACCELERATED CELL DEATH 6-like [Chenopodium quinoa]